MYPMAGAAPSNYDGSDMKEPEFIEGQEAHERFMHAMRKIVSVPREEIARREAVYKDQAAKRPGRGPKPRPSTAK